VTFKIFSKCDKSSDWFAYVRVGLYFVTKSGDRENFCDIHFYGIPEDVMNLRRGTFSGPTDSVKQVTRLNRSLAAQERYFRDGAVNSDLDIQNGGWVEAMWDAKQKVQDVWLLGPLEFFGTAYGSLVARLQGWQDSKSTYQSKVDYSLPDKELEKQLHTPKLQRFRLIPPKAWNHKFLPARLMGSTYSEGVTPLPTDKAEKTKPSMAQALGSARHHLSPAVLPKDIVKIAWKVEDFGDQLFQCETYERHG